MKSTLELIFLLEDGKTTTLELESPREDLAKADVVAVANDMIAKKAIVVGGRNITALKKGITRNISMVLRFFAKPTLSNH